MEPHHYPHPYPHPYPYPDHPHPGSANVIWFTVDQMRAQALSIMGDPNVHTPNLDRMARDGVHFPQAVSSFPLCCPARGCWLTGQYAHRAVPGHEYPLSPDLTTVADGFNAAGYHTAWLGKWHLDGHREAGLRGAFHHVPRERRGRFKTWIGYDNNNSQFDCWVHGHDGDNEVPIYRLPGHESDALTDLLLQQIDQHQDERFFLAASLQPPHDPYSAPAAYAGRHNPAKIQLRPNVPVIPSIRQDAQQSLTGYYALIEHIDDCVGRVMDRLDATGLCDHTYLIFTSDHGDMHGSHGHVGKMTAHEESIRVPMLLWGGRRWQYRDVGMVPFRFNLVDLAPTSLGLAGITAPDCMQGFDYSQVVAGGDYPESAPACGPDLATAPDSAYLQVVVPTGHRPSVDQAWRGIVTQDGWKYVALPDQPWMLYNLNEDPYEQRNLALYAHAKQRRIELQEQLAHWISHTEDEFELPAWRDDARPAYLDALKQRYPHHSA